MECRRKQPGARRFAGRFRTEYGRAVRIHSIQGKTKGWRKWRTMLWLDDYERRARLAPGLLTLLPLAVAGVGIGVRDLPIVSSLFSIIAAVGGPVALANIVRERGRALQADFFSKWSGEPTMHYLRVGAVDDVQRLQHRAAVSALTGSELPTQAEETGAPDASDSRYRAGVARLREMTRDPDTFRLVFVENRNYGFERNLLAMRPIAIWASAISCAALVSVIVLRLSGAISRPPVGDLLLALLAVVGVGCFWLWYPTEHRVKNAGETYARRLLDASLILSPPSREQT